MKQPEKSPTVNILPSIADTAIKMGEEDGGRFLYAVTNYLLYGVIPNLDGTIGLIWGAIFPNLETSRKISLGRSKGGKASKNNNPNGRRGKATTNVEAPNGSPMDAVDSPKSKHRTAPARFAPPSIEEVQQYVSAQGYAVNAVNFVDFYASKGWKIGNATMKDWKAAVRTWVSRDRAQNPVQGAQSLGVGEFINSKGIRTYGTSGQCVPQEAPPRPSEAHYWCETSNRWEKMI